MALVATSVSCPHCDRAFTSTRGIFGQDATQLRDAHIPVCEDNPRNRCHCGVIFPNQTAKDRHAATCEKNPANRFKCLHCSQEFVTTYGMMGRLATDGKALRDAHAVGCKDNPANTCFCGNLFPNPEARNAHAVTCDMNPANHYNCQFCKAHFVKTYNMFGFCSVDGRAERDAHQVACEKNPKNQCFCGRVFPNPTMRERHAATCPSNPVNRFECSFCQRLYITRYGMMGRVACDGRAQRDAHEVGCEKSPGNVCFCGQIFQNSSARDSHAVKCEMNPANRFSCHYCRKVFVTAFGMFSSNGAAERDTHMLTCARNPANATCEHCNRIYAENKGPWKWMYAEARWRCERHAAACEKNPRNRFSCERCGKCFVSSRRWLRNIDGRDLRDSHREVCDCIPCDFQVSEAAGGWLLMSSEPEFVGMDDWPSDVPLPSQSREGKRSAAKKSKACTSIRTVGSDKRRSWEEAHGQIDEAHGLASDDAALVEGIPPVAAPDGFQDMDMGDSASTCFHDAESSISDGSSESGDVSSIQEEEEDMSLRQGERDCENQDDLEREALFLSPRLRSNCEDAVAEDNSLPQELSDFEADASFLEEECHVCGLQEGEQGMEYTAFEDNSR